MAWREEKDDRPNFLFKLKLHGWSRERRVTLGRSLQSESLPGDNGRTAYRACDDTRNGAKTNVFDELKSQWGFAGFCSRNARVTSLAAKLQLLVYNMWNLFMRLLEPGRHVEAARAEAVGFGSLAESNCSAVELDSASNHRKPAMMELQGCGQATGKTDLQRQRRIPFY